MVAEYGLLSRCLGIRSIEYDRAVGLEEAARNTSTRISFINSYATPGLIILSTQPFKIAGGCPHNSDERMTIPSAWETSSQCSWTFGAQAGLGNSPNGSRGIEIFVVQVVSHDLVTIVSKRLRTGQSDGMIETGLMGMGNDYQHFRS